MNVLVITREFPPYVLGGLSYHLGHLYGALERQGHQVTVLAGKCPGYDYEAETLVPENATVYRIPFGSFRGHRVRFSAALARFLWDFDTEAYDVAFAHTELPFSTDLPLITKYHDCTREMRRFETGKTKPLALLDRAVDPVRRWVERRSLRISDRAVFNSALCRRAWGRHYDVSTPTSVIHNGVDRSIFFPRDVGSDDDGEEYVLFIGDEERKGLSRVLSFARHAPYEIRLVGFDEVGESDVTALGRVTPEELARLYSGALATIHPAKFEAFGNVVLESLACGTPVVTTDRCGAAEFLDDSCGAVTDDIASGVERCVSLDSEDCIDVARRHAWTDVAERTIAIADGVISSADEPMIDSLSKA
jgi:glycosyltransferase involved in cell wall biosynthesis